ncbi:hypothetical protein BGZ54_004239 [Gamsiella multidivaricata]|nr:hypothetical protein BGZ54_004239 [Gamsiella multidivaricata]
MSPDVSSLRYRAIAGAATLAKPAAAALGISVSQIPPHHTLTSLSITHVQFSQNNFLSKLLAYVTLSPLGIICSYVAIVLTSRDLKPLVMFAGQLANEFVNQVLKRLFKQARPTEYLGDGYGMPSSHSQFMAYFATYTAILMYRSVLRPQGVFDWIVNLPLAKQFYVRDTDAIPDLAKFDWEMWQQHRNADHTKQE